MGKYGQHNLSFRRRAVFFFMCVRGSEKILVCEQVCKIPEIFKIEKRVENKKSNTFRKRCQYPSNTSTVGKKQLLQYPVLKSIFLSSLPLRAQISSVHSNKQCPPDTTGLMHIFTETGSMLRACTGSSVGKKSKYGFHL